MEPAAFYGFFKTLSPRLRAICFKLNRGFASIDEQDLYQVGALFLWEGFRKGEFADKTQSYILQGCYFHLQNYIRCCKDRYSRVAISDDREDEDHPGGSVSLAGQSREEFLERLDTRLLADIICNNGLTVREKSLLPLFAEGLTTRQIGERMGISHVSVVKMKKVIGEKCRKYLDLKIK
jgi:RNA polymerase sigma factor (sigma-70 family)